METFVLTIFWLNTISVVIRSFYLSTGSWSQKTSIGVYAADTALIAATAIWAGFALWYS